MVWYFLGNDKYHTATSASLRDYLAPPNPRGLREWATRIQKYKYVISLEINILVFVFLEFQGQKIQVSKPCGGLLGKFCTGLMVVWVCTWA